MEILRKYGVQTDFYFSVIKRAVVDFAVGADWTPAAGDVKISKDGGAAANVTNLPTAITMGNGAMWKLTLTATEMQAAKIAVTVVDSATKAVEDQMILIATYGHASAQHAVDLADSVRAGLTALPNAAAEAAGGLYTRGSGAGQINQNANGQIDSRAVAIANGIITAATFAANALDAVWSTATRLLTAGTNIVLAKGTGITGFNDLSAAQVNSEVDSALADIHLDHLLAADYDPASKPGVATALLNELVENDAGVSRYTANALEQAPTGGSAPTAAAIADAVWDELSADHVGAGSVGERVERLDILQSGGAAELTMARAALLTNLDAAISTRATPAQVNTEVLDVLNVDVFAEPGQEAPGASISLAKKIGYLFKFLRNKITQDATTLKIFADDGTTVDQKATISDAAGTYTRGEIGTGP